MFRDSEKTRGRLKSALEVSVALETGPTFKISHFSDFLSGLNVIQLCRRDPANGLQNLSEIDTFVLR